jgi:electron transfer flavoprotein alpha subunit
MFEGYRYHFTGLHHDAMGFPTEEIETCRKLIDRLFRKVEEHKDEIESNEEYMLDDADILLIGYGSASLAIKEAVNVLREQGIKAEWACSRPVVDDGIAEYARQIGQTGKTVRPKVYVAVGISGAVQHIAGMKESETIVAVDHNGKEAIFSNADFGIVGEYEDILPELIERVKNGFTFGIEAAK